MEDVRYEDEHLTIYGWQNENVYLIFQTENEEEYLKIKKKLKKHYNNNQNRYRQGG